jgi:hypothetical protein
MSLIPHLASLLLAFALAAAVGLPDLRRFVQRRRALRRVCEACGSVILLGERTCGCVPTRDE